MDAYNILSVPDVFLFRRLSFYEFAICVYATWFRIPTWNQVLATIRKTESSVKADIHKYILLRRIFCTLYDLDTSKLHFKRILSYSVRPIEMVRNEMDTRQASGPVVCAPVTFWQEGKWHWDFLAYGYGRESKVEPSFDSDHSVLNMRRNTENTMSSQFNSNKYETHSFEEY